MNLFRENQYSQNIQGEHGENEQADNHILAHDLFIGISLFAERERVQCTKPTGGDNWQKL